MVMLKAAGRAAVTLSTAVWTTAAASGEVLAGRLSRLLDWSLELQLLERNDPAMA